MLSHCTNGNKDHENMQQELFFQKKDIYIKIRKIASIRL